MKGGTRQYGAAALGLPRPGTHTVTSVIEDKVPYLTVSPSPHLCKWNNHLQGTL